MLDVIIQKKGLLRNLSHFSFLFFFFVFFANLTFANPVTEDSAKVKAKRFLSFRIAKKGKRLVKAGRPQDVLCVKQGVLEKEGLPTYYIYSRQDGTGFAIIAGDDCMPALIGYSMENNIDVENMPDALKLMLDNYDKHVISLRNNGKAAAKSKVGPLEPGTPVVGPYIKSKWDQGEPYNWLTPLTEDGGHTPSGCVPTAAAQILNYYKWPKNSYFRKYNWNDMQDSYGNYSNAEGMAVATLMRDLGAIMETTYDKEESSTPAVSYVKLPGYKCTKVTDVKSGLSKGPLAVTLNHVDCNISHAVVVDGYDSNDLYHINWGWGGSWDGYYNLQDIAIIREKEVHPDFNSQYTYLLEPDYDNAKRISVPAAFGGIEINKKNANVGQKVTVTLRNVRLVSGSNFSGYMALFIFKAPPGNANPYVSRDWYYGEQVYGVVQYTNQKYTDFEDSTPWDASLEGTDLNISISSLPKLSSKGNYVLVPVCFNTLELPENSSVRGGDWRPLLQFADGTLVEEIPFEYNNNVYFFKEVPHGDFNIDVSQLVAASTYREKGKSSLLAYKNNKGSNNFTGTLTATIVNTDNANDVRTVDYSLYLPAHQSGQSVLYTAFDFTGRYAIKEIEVWRADPMGNRKTYFEKTINGTPFTILPYDSQTVTTEYSAYAMVQESWEGNKAYINDSIYKPEEANVEVTASSIDADTAAVDVELWAMSDDYGTPFHLKTKTIPLSKNIIRTYTIGGSTADIPLGSYRMILFGRCGNNTIIIPRPKLIEGHSDLPDSLTENIIHVFDPGIDIPRLRLNKFKQLGDLYYRTYGFVEAEIENYSEVDYIGYTNSIYAGKVMSPVSPFRILRGETATVYPRLWATERYYDESGDGNRTLCYKIDNGIRDLIIPMDGEYRIAFTEKPNKLISASSIAFYYKNRPSEKPSIGFDSKGLLKRSLWKNDQLIMTFDDLQTDSTYSTYEVFPDGSTLKDIPAGNYILKFELTDAHGHVWPPVYNPLIIDEEDLPISIEKVTLDASQNISYDSEIPIFVTVKNPTNQEISTFVGTNIYKKMEGYWSADSREIHSVRLPAMQSTKLRLNCHIQSTSSSFKKEGTFQVYAMPCRTKRGSGHLDFGYSKNSEEIDLPYINNGIHTRTINDATFPATYYSIDGKVTNVPSHGLYIVKYNDGSVKKVFFK